MSDKIKIIFVTDEEEVECWGLPGQSILSLAHENGVPLEGACEGSLACSTCHVIIESPEMFKLSGDLSDEENDMLDFAFGVEVRSRLGCQVNISQAMYGMRILIPSATRNINLDKKQ